MGDSTQFFWAMVDATKAALIGLNIVPLLILSLFIGLIQKRPAFSWLKAAIAVVPAVFVAALWPHIYDAAPIWPDLTQIETQIQLGVMFAIAWAVIWLAGLLKALLAPVNLRRPIIQVVIASET